MTDGDVRLPDLAREAGVSVATVSRVLGGRERVAEPTAAKVWDAVRRLGYSRSTLLPETARRTVAVLLPSTAAGWQRETAAAVTNAIAESGNVPVLGTACGATCAVWLGFGPPELGDDSPRPVVRLSDAVDVTPGITDAMGHLAALGHRRIGLIRPDDAFGDACERAFTASHPSAGHLSAAELARWTIRAGNDESSGAGALNALLDSTCTAVVCADDAPLLGALARAAELAMSVPRDVSLLGIGDDPRMSFTAPAATMVRIDPPALADILRDAVLAAISSGEPPAPGAPINTAPNKTASINRAPTETAPTDTASINAPLNESAPTDRASINPAPNKTASINRASIKTVPNKTAPNKTAPTDLIVRSSTGPVRGRR